MKRFAEPAAWVGLLVVLAFLVVGEGRRRAELERKVPLTPKELYAQLAKSQVRVQIVDVRPDPSEAYEDTHLPGAIPFPGCDPAATPEKARDRIYRSVPTIVVSEDGAADVFARCTAQFGNVRNLAGGMNAWDDENLPEDTGEYSPPSGKAGGGCL